MTHLALLSANHVQWGPHLFPCTSGHGGIRQDKQEGDGATPVGRFPFRSIFYRPDRIKPFISALPLAAITPNHGWCDDPKDPCYNQQITLPYAASHECLWREDNVYDLILLVGYNDDPIVPHRGSAIFVHIANTEFTQTAGCIALKKNDLLTILTTASLDSHLVVIPPMVFS